MTHVGMSIEEFRYRLAKRSGTHAMNDADGVHLGQECVIEKFVCDFDRFVHSSADDINFIFLERLR